MRPGDLRQIALILGGIPICTTLEGSIAREAGLRYGDIILRVNGKPTPTVEAYMVAKRLDREKIVVTYFRSGRIHTLALNLQRAATSAPPPLQEFVSSRTNALFAAYSKRLAN